MSSPVFFDASGHRRKLVGRIVTLLLFLIVLSAMIFAATVIEVPSDQPLDFIHERIQPLPFVTGIAHLRHRFPACSFGQAPHRCGSGSMFPGIRRVPLHCGAITMRSTG